jgi:hypothetical protein
MDPSVKNGSAIKISTDMLARKNKQLYICNEQKKLQKMKPSEREGGFFSSFLV